MNLYDLLIILGLIMMSFRGSAIGFFNQLIPVLLLYSSFVLAMSLYENMAGLMALFVNAAADISRSYLLFISFSLLAALLFLARTAVWHYIKMNLKAQLNVFERGAGIFFGMVRAVITAGFFLIIAILTPITEISNAAATSPMGKIVMRGNVIAYVHTLKWLRLDKLLAVNFGVPGDKEEINPSDVYEKLFLAKDYSFSIKGYFGDLWEKSRFYKDFQP